MDIGIATSLISLGIQLVDIGVKTHGNSQQIRSFYEAIANEVRNLSVPEADKALTLRILIENEKVRHALSQRMSATTKKALIDEFRHEFDKRGTSWTTVTEERISRFIDWVAKLQGLHLGTVPEAALMHVAESQLQETKEVSRQLNGLTKAFEDHLAKQYSGDFGSVSAHYSLASMNLSLPPLVNHLSPREQAVDELNSVIAQRVWTAVYGDIGSGKSSLANLIARGREQKVAWIDLRGANDQAQTVFRLDMALATLSGSSLQADLGAFYAQVSSSLSPDFLIVLDDVPRLDSGPLTLRLLTLMEQASLRGIKVLSTSPFRLPLELNDMLSRDDFTEVPAPLLTDVEAGDVFRAYGMTEDKQRHVAFLNNVARRNPTLLTAVARYLRKADWRFTSQQLDNLIRGDLGSGTQLEILRKLTRTVASEGARTLLHRLREILGSFGLDQVTAVAAAGPRVESALERFLELEGLWVQKGRDELFALSPLVSQLGTSDLHESTRKEINGALAKQILDKGTLDQYDIDNGILYLVKAEEFNRAGWLLTVGLNYAIENYPVAHAYTGGSLFQLIWADTTLPDEMDLELRIYIRFRQVEIKKLKAESTEYLLNDMMRLISGSPPTNVLANYARAAIAPDIAKRNFSQAAEYIKDIVANTPDLAFTDGTKVAELTDAVNTHPNLKGIETELDVAAFIGTGEYVSTKLPWIISIEASSPEDVFGWLEIFAAVPPERRKKLSEDGTAVEGWRVMANKVWFYEHDKPPEEHDWEACLATLGRLAERAKALRLEMLWAWATAGKLAVLNEYLGRLSDAERAACAALDEASSDPRVMFALESQMGFQFKIAKEYDQALPWLERASKHEFIGYISEKTHNQLHLSHIYGRQGDYEAATRHAQAAVELAKTLGEAFGIFLCRCLGELALALKQNGRPGEAFAIADEASQIILSAREDTNEWRTVFVLLSAVVAHVSLGEKFSGLAGTEPGGGPVVPEPGVMLTGSKEVDAGEVDKRLRVLPSLMVIAADEAGDVKRATQWALRASDSEFPLDLTTMLYVLSHAMSSYEQVFDLALKLGVAFTGSDLFRQMDMYGCVEGSRPSAKNFLDSLPTETARSVHKNAMGFALLPQLLRLGTLYMSGANDFQEELAATLPAYRSFAQSVSYSDDWLTGIDIMGQAFSDSVNYQDLLTKSRSSECREDLLKIMCYLAASLKPGIPIKEASQAHSAVVYYIQYWKEDARALYETFLVPFVESYWVSRFSKQRFKFGSPKLVELALTDVVNQSRTQKVEAILSAVAL